MSKSIIVISDTQIPYEDRRAVKNVIRFIGEYAPDEVVQIGDLLDFPQPSRWSKDSAAEFEGSVYADCEYARRHFLDPVRDVYSGPFGVIEGNHDERPRVYLEKYAPALAGTHAFDFDQLLDFDEYKIDVLPEVYEFAPDWVMVHGHRGGIRISPIAGNTALNAAKRFGKSLIMGHTHRLGKGHHTTGYGGRVVQQLTGIEVGNLMDMRRAGYLKGGTANWQQGFAVVRVDGKQVQADVIEIHGGKFVVDGVSYG